MMSDPLRDAIEQVEKLNPQELTDLIQRLEQQQATDISQDDKAGDILESTVLSHAQQRLKEAQTNEAKTHN